MSTGKNQCKALVEINLPDEVPKICNVKPGFRINATEGIKEKGDVEIPWVVEAVYMHIVLACHGSRHRCFGYGDLVQMGMESQIPFMEVHTDLEV